MQYTPLTSIVRSTDMKLAAAALALTLQDGTPLVFGLEDGVRVVAPSAGAAGEVLAGFAHLQTSAAPALPADAAKVEFHVANASSEITLDKTPLASQYSLVNAATGAAVAVTGAAGAVLTTDAAEGVQVKVTYRRALTVAEAVSLVGNVQPGGYSGSVMGQVGVAQQGTIYTDRFDASVNWALATGVKLAAGGIVTDQAGAGATINARVVAIPTADYPFLGLQFDTI